MWFRPGQQNDSDKFGVSSIRNRIRRNKSGKETSISIDEPVNDSNKLKSNKKSKTIQSPSKIRSNRDKDDELAAEREKILLTDRKFKSNRVAKSSSKHKIADITDKQNITKIQSQSTRKTSVIINSDNKQNTNATIKTKTGQIKSNLNINALLRYKSFISGSTKKLTSEDFDRLRRKSLSESTKKSNRKASIAKSDDKIDAQDLCGTDDEVFLSCNDDDNLSGSGKDSQRSSPLFLSKNNLRFIDGQQKKRFTKYDKRKESVYCFPTEGFYLIFFFCFVSSSLLENI